MHARSAKSNRNLIQSYTTAATLNEFREPCQNNGMSVSGRFERRKLTALGPSIVSDVTRPRDTPSVEQPVGISVNRARQLPRGAKINQTQVLNPLDSVVSPALHFESASWVFHGSRDSLKREIPCFKHGACLGRLRRRSSHRNGTVSARFTMQQRLP